MCEQCVAATVMYTLPGAGGHEVLPGYALVRATKDGWMMRKGDWGLVRMNDPDYWWSKTPVEDPYLGLTDAEIDKRPEPDLAYDTFQDAVDELQNALDGRTEPMLEQGRYNYPRFEDAIELYEAAKLAGWSLKKKPINGGTMEAREPFAYWLCNYLAVFLKTATVMPESVEAPTPTET